MAAPPYEPRHPPPAEQYTPPPVTGRTPRHGTPQTPVPRRARTRRGRAPLVVGVCAVLAAALLTAGWFALHKSTSVKFTFDGKKINHPEETLNQAQKALDVAVARRHGATETDTRCYFATMADPPKGIKRSDVDSSVRCGPVLFVDGNAARTYLSFPVTSTPGGHGTIDLSAGAQPISPQPAALPTGYVLSRPDERSAPGHVTLTVPEPPPAPHEALVAADLSGVTLANAPHDALMVSLRGGIRVTKLGEITRYGTGDSARSAPPGQRLVALAYTSVSGQIADVGPTPGQLGVSVDAGPVRRIPHANPGQVLVVGVPQMGRADLVLDADGVHQTIALPSGTPGTANLAVLRRRHIDAALSVSTPITIRFSKPGSTADMPGTLTVRHALLGYWTDDGKHHAKDGTRALLWMDFLFKVPNQRNQTGIDAPLLRVTPAGDHAIPAKDLDPTDKVFAVFDVPATFSRGTVTVSGSEPGNPTISVVKPVTFPVSIPN